MMLKSVYKVDGGKLIKISLLLNHEVIKNIKINGDFFIYPEDKIVDIENFLIAKSTENKEKLQKQLENFVKDQKIELFGIDSESIVKSIFMATELKDI